mgnify:CR=1 FL=1
MQDFANPKPLLILKKLLARLSMEPMETYFSIGLVDHLSSATAKHVRCALKASTTREHIWVLVELARHSFV